MTNAVLLAVQQKTFNAGQLRLQSISVIVNFQLNHEDELERSLEQSSSNFRRCYHSVACHKDGDSAHNHFIRNLEIDAAGSLHIAWQSRRDLSPAIILKLESSAIKATSAVAHLKLCPKYKICCYILQHATHTNHLIPTTRCHIPQPCKIPFSHMPLLWALSFSPDVLRTERIHNGAFFVAS